MWRRRSPDELTPREEEVLNLLRVGLTNEEIAQRLGISLNGARYHVSQILSKLGVATREEAAALAVAERQRWWGAWPLWAGATTAAVAVVASVAVLVYAPISGESEEDLPAASEVLTAEEAKDADPGTVYPGPITLPTAEKPVVVCGGGTKGPYPFETNEQGGIIPISIEECEAWTGFPLDEGQQQAPVHESGVTYTSESCSVTEMGVDPATGISKELYTLPPSDPRCPKPPANWADFSVSDAEIVATPR